MGFHFLVIAGPDKGRVFPLTVDDALVIGRSRTLETRLNDAQVSKIHFNVEWTGPEVFVVDQESTGGTFVNGRRVTRQAVRPGDIIRIGQTQLTLRQDSAAAETDLLDDQTMAVPLSALPQKLAAPTEPAGELTGTTLSHYLLGPLLAKGRTGQIYKARDTQNNRDAAVKVFGADFVRNDEEVQRFVRAMRTMLPLRHPNLVALYGAGKSGPYCWAAMEYVPGESLAAIIERIGTSGMLDWRRGLRFTVHVARALGHAHQSSIIHRNLTPTNVLVRSSDQTAKLGDLLLAKALEGMMVEDITKPGEVLGEVRYMSPERAAVGANVGPRSDLYSLGALAYALLTGRPPFSGSTTVETLLLIRDAKVVEPRQYQASLPIPFEAAILRLLQKRPEDRYATAAEVLADLERIAAAQGVTL